MRMTTDALRLVETVFARSALFAGLERGARRRLASLASVRAYPAGSTIVREGDTSMALYVILSGRVAVHLGTGQAVREIGACGFFGELGVIDDRPRSATVIAVEPTQCALLAAWDIREQPRIALNLLPIMAQWIREAGGRTVGTDADADWIQAL